MNAQQYAYFFEHIDKDTHVDIYRKYFDEKATFKDPFHEVEGVEKIYNIFQKMYLNLDEPRFKIDEVVEQQNVAYIKWKFFFTFKNEKEYHSFVGVSRVVFNESSKVISHEDYWDASENIYEKLPLVKHIIKFVKNKIRA